MISKLENGKLINWGKECRVKSLLVFSVFLFSNFLISDIVTAASSPDMVLIPAGEFIMGSDAADGKLGFEVSVDSIPKRRVELPAFYIDRFEVTVAQYRGFAKATKHESPALWKDYKMFGYPEPADNHPVVDVNFYDAEAYCKWAGKRLPTEAEWEKAARGTDGRIFPWGNAFEPNHVATEDRGRQFTTPVGDMKLDVSPYGVYDMAGNAMEWTASLYEPYPGNSRNFKPDTRFRILRGGSWGMPGQPFARSAHRHFRLADLAQPDFGFRCAKDAK
jgi:formylglycine-generating enzyme required for sulfatase activity